MTKFTAGLFMAVTFCVTLSANAARPSFTSLQQQINQLQAQIIQLENQDSVKLVDADGTVIGDAQQRVFDGGWGAPHHFFYVYFVTEGQLYETFIKNDQGFVGSLIYDQPGCTGNAYTAAPDKKFNSISLSAMRDGVFYVADGDVPKTLTSFSLWYKYNNTDYCSESDGPVEVYPAVPVVDTSIYKEPFQLKLIPEK